MYRHARHSNGFYDSVNLRFVGLLVIAIGLFGPLFAQEARAPKRNLRIDDLFALKDVRDPRVSPDEKWVAYTVATTDLEKDESETAVWIISANGGEPLRMTAKGSSATQPRWSPDGKYLSFLADRHESKTQVWLLDRRGGEAQQLTEVKQGIQDYAWSPDGRRLLLMIKDPKPEDLLDKKEREERKPEPWVIDRLQFKRDYIGYLDRRRTHLYVFDRTTRDLNQITSGDYDDSDAVWSPDGRLIAFVSNRTEEPDSNSNTDIWIVSADNPDKGKTLLRVTKNPGSDSDPAWSPDGARLCYVTVLEPDLIWYATNQLAVISSKGGEARVLTRALDRNVLDPRFSKDGNSIRFLLEDSGESQLAEVDATSGEVTRLTSGGRSIQGFDVIGDQVLVLNSEPHLPPEIFKLSDGTLTQLTRANAELLDRLRLARVKDVQFLSKDGTRIEGFIFLPPDYNDTLTYPTLLRIHGGPVAQFDLSFEFEAQLFAAQGYVVVLVNPRGSSGYGQQFAMGIYQAWGQKDFEDVMAGVDYAIREGYANPDRLGVGGWSYGGILTNYVITQTTRFKGAISGASEVLYVANYGHDHYQYEWEKELGLPWEHRELWEKLSPFNSVEKIVTPTLIMGGSADWNVPILNSEQLYQALRRLGRTTELIVYPGEHHGIERPSFQKDRLERYLEWYGRYVKGETKTGESSQ